MYTFGNNSVFVQIYVMQNTCMLSITDFIAFFPPWNKCFYVVKIKDEQFNSRMAFTWNNMQRKNNFYKYIEIE